MLQSISPFPPGTHPDMPLAVISTVISTVLAGPCSPGSFFIPLTIPWLLAGAVFHLIECQELLVTTTSALHGKGASGELEQGRGSTFGVGQLCSGCGPTGARGEVINPLSGPGIRNILLLQTAPLQNCYSCSKTSSWIFQGLFHTDKASHRQTLSRRAASAGSRIPE